MDDYLIFLGFMTIAMVVGFVKYLLNERTEERMEKKSSRIHVIESEENMAQGGTCQNMQSILNDMGCQPTINDDGSLTVQYQGENFHMEFGGMYVRIWDPRWAGVKVDDPDIANIREAVNVANYSFGPTIVMSAPNDDGEISLHSRRDILLHPTCPDNVPFVKATLDSFFGIKNELRKNYSLINAKQGEDLKKRRPVGFHTQG